MMRREVEDAVKGTGLYAEEPEDIPFSDEIFACVMDEWHPT